MEIAFYIVATLILILVIPISFNVKITYNISKNRGLAQVRLWGMSLFFYRIKITSKKIILKNRKETKTIDFDINAPNVDLINEIQQQLFSRFFLKELTLYINWGNQKDASTVALAVSSLQIALNSLFTYIQSQKPTAELMLYIKPKYTTNNKFISFKTRFSISLTNIVQSILKAKIKIAKKETLKNNGKKLQTSN